MVALAIVICTYALIVGNTIIQDIFTVILVGVVVCVLMELFVVPHTVPMVGGVSVSMILMMLMSDGALFLVVMVTLI